jgi:hypothetical protein
LVTLMSLRSTFSLNKSIFLIVSIVIVALLIDTSFIKIYPFILSQSLYSFNVVTLRIAIFSVIGIIYFIGQYFILRFVRLKSKEIGNKEQLHLNIIHKIVTITQYALTAILVIVFLQIIVTSRYNIVMLMAATSISYILAIIMMGLLAKRFFLWFRSNKNSVVLFYGLASTILAINLGFVLVFVDGILSLLPPYVRIHMAEYTAPFIAPNSIFSKLNEGFVISSVVSFILSWIATALLLRQYSRRLGRIGYWIIVSIPLAYFLTQFQALVDINFFATLFQLDPISFSAFYTLFFALSQPAGGILFAIAFWTVARSVPYNSAVRDYMVTSAYGLVLLFVSNGAIILLNLSYPPFGLATISFLGLSSYLLLVGIYSSAISVAQDTKLRQSIRKSVEKQSKLLDSIGSAHIEQEIQTRVLRMSKEYQDHMTEETGLESSINEDEIKEYLNTVIKEIKNKEK